MRKILLPLAALLSTAISFGQQPTQMVFEFYQGSAIDSTVETFTYSGNHLLNRITSSKPSAGNWSIYSKLSETYNAQDLLSERRLDLWSNSTGTWTNYLKTSTTYTVDEQEDVVTNEIWSNNSNAWRATRKEAYAYNPQTGLRDSLVTSLWDNTSGWYLNSKSVYTWASGNLETTEYFNYDNQTSGWLTFGRSSYIYDSEGLVETIQHESFTDTWNPTRLETKTWNEAGKLTMSVIQDWIDGNWSNDSRVIYTYNPDNTLHGTITEAYVNGNWQLLLMRETHFYGPGSVGISTNTKSEFAIYPNPAQDMVTIVSGQPVQAIVTLTDLQGKQLRTFESGHSVEQLSLSGLPAGTYLLQISTSTHSETHTLNKL